MGPCLEGWETEGPGSCREKRPAGLQCLLDPVGCVALGFGPYLQELTVISSDVKRVCQIPWELKVPLGTLSRSLLFMLDSVCGFVEAVSQFRMHRTVYTWGVSLPLVCPVCVCGFYMTPFRGRVACVFFLIEAIFLDELSPQALCPVGEKLLQAQVPQARAGLECSLSLPVGWGGAGLVQIYISGCL